VKIKDEGYRTFTPLYCTYRLHHGGRLAQDNNQTMREPDDSFTLPYEQHVEPLCAGWCFADESSRLQSAQHARGTKKRNHQNLTRYCANRTKLSNVLLASQTSMDRFVVFENWSKNWLVIAWREVTSMKYWPEILTVAVRHQ